jgi:hypothetical protein
MNLMNLAKKQWDRSAGIVFTAVGVIALIGGWLGVRGTPILAEQTRYIVSGGLGAIFLLGLGATLWISADLRDEWRKLDRIEQSLGDGGLRWAGDGCAETTPETAVETVDLTLAIPAGQPRAATTASSNA